MLIYIPNYKWRFCSTSAFHTLESIYIVCSCSFKKHVNSMWSSENMSAVHHVHVRRVNSVLFVSVFKLFQKIFLQKMKMTTDPFLLREMGVKTQVVRLCFWCALTVGEMRIFAGQELDERIDTNVISACWKRSCGQQRLGFSSTFRLQTGNRAA